MEIRLARADDAAATRDIYNREVTSSTVTFDLRSRTLAEQEEWLTARAGAHAVLVAVDPTPGESGNVVGFASLSPFRDRPGYSTTVESSVYVHADQRGRGVGRALLDRLVTVATDHGFHAMIARIVGGHATSIALHEAAGFELVGVEREVGRKFGRWLDVVVMERLLRETGSEPGRTRTSATELAADVAASARRPLVLPGAGDHEPDDDDWARTGDSTGDDDPGG